MNDTEIIHAAFEERFPKREMPAHFKWVAEIDAALTEKAGYNSETGEPNKPAFVNRLYVVIGDPESREKVSRPATEIDKRTYPRAWAYFDKTKDLTPIAHLPKMTPADVELCHAARLPFVELMADADPASLWPELLPWHRVANAYVGRKPRVRLEVA
jgi:hypothetical protein